MQATQQRYFNIQSFNFVTGRLEPLQLRKIGYRYDRRTGNYILVYINPDIPRTSRYARQEIMVQEAFFMRVVPNNDIIAGCIEITPAQYAELGFVNHNVREVGSDAATA